MAALSVLFTELPKPTALSRLPSSSRRSSNKGSPGQVAIAVGVSEGVYVGVYVLEGVLVGVAVKSSVPLLMTRLQARSVPVSAPALSLTVSFHVPLACSPSKVDSGMGAGRT